MFNFRQISPYEIVFLCDTNIYKNDVISKVLYTMVDRFLCFRQMESCHEEKITLKKKDGIFHSVEINELEKELNQKFIDFHLRQIIQKETKDIRSILYIKAFANQKNSHEIQQDGK
jgi:hypothetical protein